MQMGADTREHEGSWSVVHGIGVSSLFVHGRVRPTQSRSYRYLTLYGTIVERVESGDTSGRITYTSTSQMHVRSASVALSVISIWVVGHGRFPCRFSLRSARHALRTREGSSTLLGHGVDRSHGHPALLLPRHSFATSNRATHGGRKYGGEECTSLEEKRDSGMANSERYVASWIGAILYLFSRANRATKRSDGNLEIFPLNCFHSTNARILDSSSYFINESSCSSPRKVF